MTLDAKQLDVLRTTPPKRLLEIVDDLTARDDPWMTQSLFLLAMHPAFQRPNATPENVRLACLELLKEK